MKRQLETGDVDLCISSTPIEGPDIEWKPLMTEEIFIIVQPGHHLASHDSICLHEVKDESFISMNAGYGFRNLTDDFCREAGFTPKVAFEGDEPDVIGRLVREGLGIAFVPALSWKGVSNPLPVRLRITEPICGRIVGLAWSRRHYLSSATKEFRDFVIDYFSHITSDF
jgi:DNA-binding transcriptional LysR family regulator